MRHAVPENHSTSTILLALLAEVRGIRRALERTQTPALEVEVNFLAAVAALMGSREWTCQELIEELEMGETLEVASLQAVLRELNIATPRDLGNFLRGKAGTCSGELALRRHRANRVGAMRWSIWKT